LNQTEPCGSKKIISFHRGEIGWRKYNGNAQTADTSLKEKCHPLIPAQAAGRHAPSSMQPATRLNVKGLSTETAEYKKELK
jgi:hypothetical protein